MKYINFDKKHFDAYGGIKFDGQYKLVAYKKLNNGLYKLATGEMNATTLKLQYIGDFELETIEHKNADFHNGVSTFEKYFNTDAGRIYIKDLTFAIPFDDVKLVKKYM